MDLITAHDITTLWCAGDKINAIKVLRRETALGLIDAKNYLETGIANGGKDGLIEKFCVDYVQNKEDLLVVARGELRRLQLYVEQLESEIAEEARAADVVEHVMVPFLSTIVYKDIPTGDQRRPEFILVDAHPTEPWHGQYEFVLPEYCQQCLEHKHEGQCERYWSEDMETWYNYSDELVEVLVVGLMFELETPDSNEENS